MKKLHWFEPAMCDQLSGHPTLAETRSRTWLPPPLLPPVNTTNILAPVNLKLVLLSVVLNPLVLRVPPQLLLRLICLRQDVEYLSTYSFAALLIVRHLVLCWLV